MAAEDWTPTAVLDDSKRKRGKPERGPWCGTCGERTRHVTPVSTAPDGELAFGAPRRCHACHPQSGHECGKHVHPPGSCDLCFHGIEGRPVLPRGYGGPPPADGRYLHEPIDISRATIKVIAAELAELAADMLMPRPAFEDPARAAALRELARRQAASSRISAGAR